LLFANPDQPVDSCWHATFFSVKKIVGIKKVEWPPQGILPFPYVTHDSLMGAVV
jgi:hypothetical protein